MQERISDCVVEQILDVLLPEIRDHIVEVMKVIHCVQWEDDKQTGEGTEEWSHGARYIGRYRLNRKDGQGLFEWADISRYEGQFVENDIDGQGFYSWSRVMAFSLRVIGGPRRLKDVDLRRR